MKIHMEKHRLDVSKSDLSGSVFDDVNLSGGTYENVNLSGGSYHNINLSGCTFDDLNMSGWRVDDANLAGLRITNANLAGASISNSRLDGMTIDGIEVTDLVAAWKEREAAPSGVPRTVTDVLNRPEIVTGATPRPGAAPVPISSASARRRPARAGCTTSLRFHPEFWMPPVKELHFFDGARPGFRKAGRLQGGSPATSPASTGMPHYGCSQPLERPRYPLRAGLRRLLARQERRRRRLRPSLRREGDAEDRRRHAGLFLLERRRYGRSSHASRM